MSDTPHLSLPLMAAAQAQKHVTHNEALLRLDSLVQLSVVSRALTAPPSTAEEGARYIVGDGATGDWAGHPSAIAVMQAGGWVFMAPQPGWRSWVEDEELLVAFAGTAWVSTRAAPQLQNVPMVGVNATADSGNRLAVASPAVLLNNAGAGVQLKLNKNTASDTAAALYQTSFSGRAEIGLSGDDNLHVKVSANGSAWTEALVIDRTTGVVTLPATPPAGLADGARGDVTVSGSGAVWTIAGAALNRAVMKDAAGFTDVIENRRFEAGDTAWTKGAGWTITNDPVNAETGNWIAVDTDTTNTVRTMDSQPFAVSPGDSISAALRLKTSASFAASHARAQLWFLDRDKTIIAASNVDGSNFTGPQTSYATSSLTATAPAGAAYALLRILSQKTAGTLYVDSVDVTVKRDAGMALRDGTITNALLATVPALTIKGNGASTAAAPSDLTGTQVTSLLNTFSVAAKGLVPPPSSAAGKYLRDDGTWTLPTGSGDVTGPAVAVDKSVVRFSGTSGKSVQASLVVLNDDGSLRLPLVTAPSAAPADSVHLHAADVAGRDMPAVRSPFGMAYALQPFFARTKIGIWSPPGNATTLPAVFGFPSPVVVGTATARNVATTNALTRMRRLGFVSAATAASLAGFYGTTNQFTVGDAASLGGFTLVMRFGVSDAASVSGARMFVGLRTATAAPTNVEPSTMTNIIGVAALSTSSNLQIVYGGSTAQTPIDLGANFPANTLSADAYELTLYAPVGSATVGYRVERLGTAYAATGTLAGTPGTAIPAVTTLLNVTAWRCNNASALAVGIDLTSVYIETDI